MNFCPYHNFTSCDKLETTIQRIQDNGMVPPTIYDAYLLYHFSLIHKLQSAKYHVESLERYLTSEKARSALPQDLVYRVNFHLDGFLHVIGSANDIFAREILSYFNIPLRTRIYYHTAHIELSKARPTDCILTFLTTPSWFKEFSDYRNTATHESIVSTTYSIRIEVKGSNSINRLEFPLPDNPRSPFAERSYNRNRDIVAYSKTTFKRVLSHFSQTYQHLSDRLSISGSLPL